MIHEGNHPVVVVVDDDTAVLDSFRFLLEMAGFPVRVFSSGPALLAATPPRPRCVIADQHMPGMTGLELAMQLQASGMLAPLLLVTSSPSPAIIARAKEIGVRGVLEKPPNDDAVIAFIESCHPG